MSTTLTDAERAYIEAAFWTAADDEGEPLADDATVDDLNDLPGFLAELRAFIEGNADLIARSGLPMSQVGHDFSLTRNGHGAGFWDRGLGQIGQDLTEACRPYGETYIYRGDDGRLYWA